MADARASQLAVEVLGVPQAGALVAQVAVEVLSAVPLPDARVGQVAVEVLSVRPDITTTLDRKSIVFLAEMTGAIDDAGTLATYYATDGIGWVTGASDTPADTHVQPTLTNPGTYRRELFSGNRPYGAVRPSFGAATLTNLDGRYDGWKFHGFDGRRYTVYAGQQGAAFPSGWTVVFRATIEELNVGFREVTIKLRDDLALLDKSILTETFAGTGGVEGQEDLAGTPKPRVIGDPVYHPVTPIPLYGQVAEYRPKPITFTASAHVETLVGGDVLLRAPLPYNVYFDVDFDPSSASAIYPGTTTDTVFYVYRHRPGSNYMSIGTVTFPVGERVGVWDIDSDWIAGEGESIVIIEAGAPDATLEGVSVTIAGFVTTLAASDYSPDPI